MSDFSREFPQYLNRPLQVLWWETDDLIMMMMAFFIALVFGGWTWLLVLVVPITYGRMKKNRPRGFLVHSFYFLGFLSFKGYPSYFEREFLE